MNDSIHEKLSSIQKQLSSLGIHMSWESDIMDWRINIKMIKGQYALSRKIDRQVFSSDYDMVRNIQSMIDDLNKTSPVENDILKSMTRGAMGTFVVDGSNPGSIAINVGSGGSGTTIRGTQATAVFTDDLQRSTFSEVESIAIRDLKERARKCVQYVTAPFASKDHVIIAGGCFTSWFYQQEPKDIDVFFLNEDSKSLASIINNITKRGGTGRFKETDPAYLLNAGNNQITHVVLDTKSNVQYIVTKYKTRRELIDHFDAEHTCVSYDVSDDKLYISRSTYDCIAKKILKSHNDNKIAQRREEKFLSRGFKFASVGV